MEEVARALVGGELGEAPLDEAERRLLAFAGAVTESADQITDAQVQELRELGWGEAQIAEAVYVAGLAAMTNRVVDAFGLVARGMGAAPREGATGDALTAR
jgi:alkylhydroperoxidase family enzyme